MAHKVLVAVATLLLLLVASYSNGQTVVVTGHIESCSGSSLNRFPELKSFLLDGEAESYENISIEYIQGGDATMNIGTTTKGTDGEGYKVEEETIDLTLYNNKQSLHELFQQKGFVLKNEEEIRRMKEDRHERREKESEQTEMKQDFKQKLMDVEQEIRSLRNAIDEYRSGDGMALLVTALHQKNQQYEKLSEEYEKMTYQLTEEEL